MGEGVCLWDRGLFAPWEMWSVCVGRGLICVRRGLFVGEGDCLWDTGLVCGRGVLLVEGGACLDCGVYKQICLGMSLWHNSIGSDPCPELSSKENIYVIQVIVTRSLR